MILHPKDNVGLALTKLKENYSFENVITKNNIPAGHKIALVDIQKGDTVKKYNQIIGFASQTILAGEHVHTHNIEFRSFERVPESELTNNNSANTVSKSLYSGETASFKGYL